ncbi:uncharacterized protein LOC115452248 [Manduca sexta]|uniref:uncharacterized protein LOC115452248 n=1 Tax=Manduca sexta TaxID=7130 RepID=UPI00188DF871|nr:uncharacterized protein LOC115452248 [Manduca sexta]
MKRSAFIFLILLLQRSTYCTIDINVSELLYLSHKLTPKVCRKLYAALQFLTYDLPATLTAVEQRISSNETCFKLLAKWNSGTEKWEGKGKSHIEVEHRLRQIGRRDLADWLGKTVFHKLSVNVMDALSDSFIENDTELPVLKLYQKARENDECYWTMLDSVLWFVLIGVIGMILVTLCRIIYLACKKRAAKKNGHEEMLDLLNRENVDSDQETIFDYECVVKKE